MPKTIKELISETNNLISFPIVVTQFNEAINNGLSDTEELGRIIQQDPALTAKLLQLANSAYFGSAVPIENANGAIIRIGTKQVRDLAFSISAKSSFDDIPNDLISTEDFWKHSLLCALSARAIAKSIKLHPAEALFTAGLLHDIGHLVLFTLEPKNSAKALELSLDQYDGMDLSSAERSIFNYDHAEVGIELARNWNLPELLQVCIGYHHAPSEDLPNAMQVAVVHIANTVASLIEVDCDDLSQGPPINEVVWKILDTDLTIVESCFSIVKEEYSEMAGLLFENTQVAA